MAVLSVDWVKPAILGWSECGLQGLWGFLLHPLQGPVYWGGLKVCGCTVVSKVTSSQNLSPWTSYRKKNSVTRSENVYLVALDTGLSGKSRRLGIGPRNPSHSAGKRGLPGWAQAGHPAGNTWGLVPPENSKGLFAVYLPFSWNKNSHQF